jgi:hypothetical protein
MKKLKCNLCVAETYVEIDREPNHIYDKIVCKECDVTLAYVLHTPYTKKLSWQPNNEYQKQVGICIAKIIKWD